MFKTSDVTDALDEALAKAQAEIEGALKTKTNPHFKSKYADLASHWEACREALAKHSISVTQWPVHSEDNKLHLLTRIAFKGQYLQCEMSSPLVKQDPQGMGSAITYMKRYALAAALGIATEDDDGNQASYPPKAQPSAPTLVPTPSPAIVPRLTDNDIAKLLAFGAEKGWTSEVIHRYVDKQSKGKIKSLKDLSQNEYARLCDTVQHRSPSEVTNR